MDKNLEKVKWQDVKQIDRPLEKWLIKVRQLVQHPVQILVLLALLADLFY